MASATNYTNLHNLNQKTLSLKLQLNQIGKTDKTIFNRVRNITSKSKSRTFLNNIARIITEIAPLGILDNPDNFEKIKKIKSLLNDFIEKKGNFPELISQANECIKYIDFIIKRFEVKKLINNVNLNEEIKNALKTGIIDIRGNNKENTNKKLKKKIMDLYKQFLDKYIENYMKLLDYKSSNSNKKSSMEQIDLLDLIHPLFYEYYNHLIDQEDQEITKKVTDIQKLKQFQFMKNYNRFLD